MGWWSEWFLPLLIASVVLLIFNGGWAMTVFLWMLYISNGIKQVEAVKKVRKSNEDNEQELNNHILIGIIVILASGIFKLISSIKY